MDKIRRVVDGLDPWVLITVAMLSAIFFLPMNPLRWQNQDMYGLFGVTVLVAEAIRRRFGIILAANVAWVLGVGIFYFKHPIYYFGIFADLAQMMYPSTVADAVIWCLAAIVLGYWLSAKFSRIRILLDASEWMFYLTIAVMIGRRLFDQEFHRYLGAMDNEAQDATLLLVLYALSLIRLRRPLLLHLLFGLFILITGSTTAILGLGLVWFIWLMMKYSMKAIWGLVPIFSFIGLSAYWVSLNNPDRAPHLFLNSNGRWNWWTKSFYFWFGSDWFHKIIGTGPGSYEIYGPGLQLQNTVPGKAAIIAIWLHNDYLQCLFELGFVGLFLFGILHIQVLYRSYKSNINWLFLACLAFAFIELTQMPSRHAPTSIVGVLILVLSLGKYGRNKEV